MSDPSEDQYHESRDDEALQTKYELLTRASTDAFWDWNPQTDEIARSEEYLDAFGYNAADVAADTDWWRDRIHPEDRSRVLERLDEALADPETTYDETYRFRKKDGSYGYVRSRGYVVYDEDGEPERMVGAHIDVTDQKRYEKELEQQNERLDEFANIVSHDLRNPLNVATGHLEYAKAECESDYLDKVSEALDRMNRLVDDLLTLAQQGEAIGDPEAIDLGFLSRTCWQHITTANATLDIETDQEIMADRGRLQQLLENLFANAIDHGGTEVTVTVGDLTDPPGFYVADDGPGIKTEHRERIFESGFSTTVSGTGFGLAIVKRIAEAHDWTLQVGESSSGGARFEFSGVEPAA